MSLHKDSLNLQVKLENEREIFHSDYKLPESPESSLPYRKIWDVSFYNKKAELVSLNEITKSGPFVGVASAIKSEGVKDHYRNAGYKISLHPVLEYSLELPYGRQALVWVTTENACYRIMSISANYVPYWQPFYDKVCFSGHVVNILLNYRGPLHLVRLVIKITRLSGKSAEETYESFKSYRKFIHELLKDQNLSSKIRKEYNRLMNTQTLWTLTWADHVTNSEAKLEKVGKMNILSFFRPKSSDENSKQSFNISSSVKRPSSNADETSSLLSISEHGSSIYVEYPSELSDDMEKSPESKLQTSIASSFTSAKLLEWKLFENDSSFKCPICQISFNSEYKDCLTSFIIHLKAHRSDYGLKYSQNNREENFVNDFECRFNHFRNDLNDLISGRISYNSTPLTFDKKIEFTPKLVLRSFDQYSLLNSEESLDVESQTDLNPIHAVGFEFPSKKTSKAKRPRKTLPLKSANPEPETLSSSLKLILNIRNSDVSSSDGSIAVSSSESTNPQASPSRSYLKSINDLQSSSKDIDIQTNFIANFENCDKCGMNMDKSVLLGHQCETPSETKDSFSKDKEIFNPGKRVKTDPDNSTISIPTAANFGSNPFASRFPNLSSINNYFFDYWGKHQSSPLTESSTSNLTESSRKCWNCSHLLQIETDDSSQIKYCPHCSAIVE